MWTILESYAPDLVRSAWMTLLLSLAGGAIALATALPLGVLLTSPWRVLRWLARCWVELFRGVSAVVLLFFCFYVLPLLGYPLTPFQAAAVGLGVNIGAYGADVVRGAILSVPKGQTEAAHALSMGPLLTMRRVVFPQASVMMLPSLATLQVILLKATAVASLISVTEMTAEANRIATVAGHREELYLTILVVYFLMAYSYARGFRWVETRLAGRMHVARVGA